MSANFTIFAQLDQTALGRIAQMGTGLTLYPAMRQAMTESLDVLETEAQTTMGAEFMNTTGQVENAFVQYPGTFESELENTEPYSQRLNYGFSGMTDSLGRYYPYWPAYLWAETTVIDAAPDVEAIWAAALGRI
jgi:hypothetical protein